ncbi:tyrosine recombinase XerC [Cutibacterium acnes JCM 18909]|nr:tyrosine recombinase XerC [Cutibacterium acnes JCM 18909]
MSLTVPVEDFCDHLSALRRSPNTIRGYRADLIDLMSHAHSHGDDILGKIGTSQVRAWLADTRVLAPRPLPCSAAGRLHEYFSAGRPTKGSFPPIRRQL